MTTHGQNSSSRGFLAELHSSPDEYRPLLDSYLLQSMQKLNQLTEQAGRGEGVDRVSRDWMLAQVDFIVETIGDESLELSDEMRSNLLQLLLAVANLNEHIRHKASLTL
jgi:hypothetical protein